MLKPTSSPYLVSFKEDFSIKRSRQQPPKDAPGKRKCVKLLQECVEEINELQRIFYASDKHSLLLVFQAMDAAGKDGTIRAVLSGINPAGFQVYSFKQPSSEELDHDFLWRTARRLPERGRIGVFNRSYYEETLVVQVHPEYLKGQRIPDVDPKKVWEQRYKSIRDHEEHLANNGTVIRKFFLNVSYEEQRARFLKRIDDPSRNWKFAPSDVKERGFWPDYMKAYQRTLRETSRPCAPWYAIPADDKPFMRLQVARIIRDTLRSMDLSWPEVTKKERADMKAMRAGLVKD